MLRFKKQFILLKVTLASCSVIHDLSVAHEIYNTAFII